MTKTKASQEKAGRLHDEQDDSTLVMGGHSTESKQPGVKEIKDALRELVCLNLDQLDLEEKFRELKCLYGFPLGTLRQSYFRLKRAVSQMPTELVTPLTSEQLEVENSQASDLSKSKVFEQFHIDLEKLGYIASSTLARTLLMSHGALLLPKSTAFVIQGLSSSGKTDAVLTAALMLPLDMVLNYTALSEQAFFYLGDIRQKYLILGEIKPLQPGQDDARQSAMRQLISENRITRLVVEKANGNENRSVEKITEGPCVVIATTTSSQQHWCDEFANRVSWISSDGSEEQTELVMKLQAASAEAIPHLGKNDARETIKEKWRAFYRSLRVLPVVIPFARLVIPTSRHVTARRLNALLQDLIRISALLHQHGRPVKVSDHLFSDVQAHAEQENGTPANDVESSVQCSQRSEYIEATIDDYELAYELIQANAPRVLEQASEPAIRAYEQLMEKFNTNTFTTGDAQRALADSKETVRRWLWELSNDGLLLLDGKQGKQNQYVIGNGKKHVQELGLIPPEELKVLVGEKTTNSIKSSQQPEIDVLIPGEQEVNTTAEPQAELADLSKSRATAIEEALEIFGPGARLIG